MSGLLQALTVLLPCAYLLATFLHGMAFASPGAAATERMRKLVTAATLLLHAAWFAVYGERIQGFPIVDTASSASAVVFATLVLQTVLARWFRNPGSGGIVLAMLAFGQLFASATADLRALPRPGTVDVFGIVHVWTSVLALSALVLSGVHGVVYLTLLRQMRLRQFGALFAGLPDLDVLARLTRGAAMAGFLCLTVGLNVGIWLAHRDHSSGFAYRDVEVALTIVVWLHFGAIAFSRWIRGFNARRASIAAAAGLLVVLLSIALLFVPGTTFHGGR
jgi:ABC-type transport system involved in cytochrome c biogenesis permease subunit